MNKQEAYDKVCAHMVKQGCRATNEDGECLYLAPNGNKCAIGALLTEKELNLVRTLVGSVFDLKFKYPNLSIFETLDKYFLADVQGELHDDIRDMKDFPKIAHEFAEKHNLKPYVFQGEN